MSSPATILFVHGAWHNPNKHYLKLISRLRDVGFDVIAPSLPSSNGAKPANMTLNDDVQHVRDQATQLVNQGRCLMVACHSYGGIVTTNALSQELSWAARQKSGQSGGVVQLLYLCAFLPAVGGSVANLAGSSGAPLTFTVAEDGTCFPDNPLEAFYNDVDADEAQTMAARLAPQPIETFATATTNTAWQHYPITYLYCTLDHAIIIALQRRMVEAVIKGGCPDVRTETLEMSHSPFLVQPDKLVALFQQAWNAYADKYKYKACSEHRQHL